MLTDWLQQAGEGLLEFDPDTRARLVDLAGKVICLDFSGSGQRLYLLPTSAGLHLATATAEPVDLTLRGSPVAFIKFALAGDQASLASGGVQIDGDAVLAQQLVKLFKQLDIDWEEWLARYLGDVGAHQLARLGRGLREWSTATAATVRQDLAEYLQEESRILAPAVRVNRFLLEVGELRSDTERLQQRIARLAAGLK